MKLKLFLLFLIIPFLGYAQSQNVVENTYGSIVIFDGNNCTLNTGITKIKYNYPDSGWISIYFNKTELFLELEPLENSVIEDFPFLGEERKVNTREFVDSKGMQFKVFLMLDKPERAEVHFLILNENQKFEHYISFMSEDYVNVFFKKIQGE